MLLHNIICLWTTRLFNELYRSNRAQAIHTVVVNFINGTDTIWHVQEIFTRYRDDEQAFTELSKNGQSHLLDILHLINLSSEEIARERTKQLLTTLFRIVDHPKIIKFLLIQKDRAGFTPFYHVLTSDQSDNLNLYLNKVEQARKSGSMAVKEYESLLTGSNQMGFTPLHHTLMSGSSDNLKMYFIAVQQARKEGIIRPDEYKRLLIGPNKLGFTPLHTALQSVCPDKFRIYFENFQQAKTDGIISSGEYGRLLANHYNQEERTTLYSALCSGQSYNVCTYFEMVKQARREGLITDEVYKFLLIRSNRAGFTPLHKALISGQFDNLKKYFVEVQQARESNIISSEEYKCLLIRSNQAGFTPLHDAIKSKTKNLEIYLEMVKLARSENIINDEEYKRLLLGVNQAAFTPLHAALVSGQSYNVHIYFEIVKQARREGLITGEEYKFLLIRSNRAGFTPLHQALKSGQFNAILIYFDELQQAKSTGLITFEEFRLLLAGVNSNGLTPLHLAVNRGTLIVVTRFVQFIRDNCDNEQSAEIIQQSLTTKYRGHTPDCSKVTKEGQEINQYLGELNNKKYVSFYRRLPLKREQSRQKATLPAKTFAQFILGAAYFDNINTKDAKKRKKKKPKKKPKYSGTNENNGFTIDDTQTDENQVSNEPDDSKPVVIPQLPTQTKKKRMTLSPKCKRLAVKKPATERSFYSLSKNTYGFFTLRTVTTVLAIAAFGCLAQGLRSMKNLYFT
jgi:ankyrin repeat protein